MNNTKETGAHQHLKGCEVPAQMRLYGHARECGCARFVGAPLNAGAYPKGFRASECKTHVFLLDARGNPTRVLCGKAALSSYYEDTTQHVAPAGVTCETCAKRFKRQSSSSGGSNQPRSNGK